MWAVVVGFSVVLWYSTAFRQFCNAVCNTISTGTCSCDLQLNCLCNRNHWYSWWVGCAGKCSTPNRGRYVNLLSMSKRFVTFIRTYIRARRSKCKMCSARPSLCVYVYVRLCIPAQLHIFNVTLGECLGGTLYSCAPWNIFKSVNRVGSMSAYPYVYTAKAYSAEYEMLGRACARFIALYLHALLSENNKSISCFSPCELHMNDNLLAPPTYVSCSIYFISLQMCEHSEIK